MYESWSLYTVFSEQSCLVFTPVRRYSSYYIWRGHVIFLCLLMTYPQEKEQVATPICGNLEFVLHLDNAFALMISKRLKSQQPPFAKL